MPPAAHGGSSAARAREHLLETLRPVVQSLGYDLEDITVSSAGRRSLVRVSVDADGGIDMDAITAVSRKVSEVLDDPAESGGAPEFTGPYVLEVSSPGVDRPLTEPRHWRRAVGRLVEVPVADEVVVGRVLNASGTGVTMNVNGAERELTWPQLGRGKVQIEFNRAEDDKP